MNAQHGKSLESRLSKAKALDGGAAEAITLMEAAARLRVGRSTMQKLVRERKVRSFKVGTALRISVGSLKEFVAKAEKRKV